MADGGVKISIEDTVAGTVEELTFDSASQFRLVYLTESGTPRSMGSAPFKAFGSALKRAASGWAEQQDHRGLAAAFAVTRRQAMSEELLRAGEGAVYADAGRGIIGDEKKGDRVAWRVLLELALAVARRWSRLLARPLTVWEFTEPVSGKQDSRTVRDWLFRRKGR